MAGATRTMEDSLTSMQVMISADRQTASLTWPEGQQSLAAEHVEQLIRGLAEVRAQMLPTPPAADPRSGDTVILASRWYVEPDAAARDQSRVMLQVPGLGWCGIVLDGSASRQLITLMESFLQREQPH